MQEIWVDRENYRNTKIVDVEPAPLGEGEIRVAVDKYGLTANNVSYAVSGDMIGYWKYYPVSSDDGVNWGRVPVWGLTDVVESECDGIVVGERIYGFFPMASHVVLKPGKISDGSFADVADHRRALPSLYNRYMRTEAEADYLKTLENERCLLFPLFATGYGIADYLEDNDFFGATQILIGSVSSKTGFSAAAFLKSETEFTGKVIGLTSPGNKDFVESLGCCDQVVIYGREDEIDAGQKSVYMDMSGNGDIRSKLHHHIRDNMVRSIGVGVTHWEQGRKGGDMPGAKPEFFFYPAQIAKRDAEWGRGVLFQKAYAAGALLAKRTEDNLVVEFIRGPEAARDIWVDMLDNNVSPKRGIMASLNIDRDLKDG